MYWTTLIKICVSNDENKRINFKKLTKYMNQINITTETGNSPLHFVALGNNLNLASWLIKNGATFELNDHGETPLHWACKQGNSEMVSLLLKNMTKHEINMEDWNHATAARWAKDYNHKDIAVCIRKSLKA